MNMETIRELQAYGFFFFTIFLVVILYSYYYYLYKSERNGNRNYEKYSDLVLDDELSNRPLEPNNSSAKGL